MDKQQSSPSSSQLLNIKAQLSAKPVLIAENEIFACQQMLQKLYHHLKNYFILQIGDCAETFEDSTKETVLKKCEFYQKIAFELQKKLKKEILLIGRIAGQYAKPRTDDFERRNGFILPSYRGDMINSYEFEEAARNPNSSRMLKAYECAKNTIQFMNEFYLAHSDKKIFTSHEALQLDYELSLTRPCTLSQNLKHYFHYNGSAHTVWLGDRARNMNDEHVEYLSTIANPIGIKIGPTQSPDTLVSLLKKLNPNRIPGKLYLITRLGTALVQTHLPKLIDAVKKEDFPVLWCTDPMHGNTYRMEDGRKVRAVTEILEETLCTAKIHQSHGTVLSGLHLEATFLPVTECVMEKKRHGKF